MQSDILDILFKSFSQYSIIWIIISGVIGGAITQIFKYLFEQTLPKWQRQRSTRIAIQKYSYPLLLSSYSLEKIIENILSYIIKKEHNELKDDYFRKLLFLYGCFFGWCKILSNESLLEYSERSTKIKSMTSERFALHYNMVLKGISDLSYFLNVNDMSPGEIKLARIPAFASSCIGDLMIKETTTDSKEGFSNLISFLDFTRKYSSGQDYKKWFLHVENMLYEIIQSPLNANWNRLIVFYTHLLILIDFLEREEKSSGLFKWDIFKCIMNKIAKVLNRNTPTKLIILDSICQNIHPTIKENLQNDLNELNYMISYKNDYLVKGIMVK